MKCAIDQPEKAYSSNIQKPEKAYRSNIQKHSNSPIKFFLSCNFTSINRKSVNVVYAINTDDLFYY